MLAWLGGGEELVPESFSNAFADVENAELRIDFE